MRSHTAALILSCLALAVQGQSTASPGTPEEISLMDVQKGFDTVAKQMPKMKDGAQSLTSQYMFFEEAMLGLQAQTALLINQGGGVSAASPRRREATPLGDVHTAWVSTSNQLSDFGKRVESLRSDFLYIQDEMQEAGHQLGLFRQQRGDLS